MTDIIRQSEANRAMASFLWPLQKQCKSSKAGAALTAFSSVALKTQPCPSLQTTLKYFFSEKSLLYRMSFLFTFYGAFSWTFFFFFTVCGFTVAAVFCSLFCSIAARCTLCNSLNETSLSCSSRATLNFSLYGPFVWESCTALRPWHCTVEIQRDLSCVYLSSPSFHINVNLCLGIGTGMHVPAGNSDSQWGNQRCSSQPINRLRSVTFLSLWAGSLSHRWCYMSDYTQLTGLFRRALKHVQSWRLAGWLVNTAAKQLSVSWCVTFSFF